MTTNADVLSSAGAGFGVQAFVQGEGALGSLAKFATSFDAGEKLVEVSFALI